MEEFINIPVRKKLYDQMSKEIQDSFNFETVEQLVDKILELFLSKKGESELENICSDEKVAKRLQDLGYM